MHGSRLPRRYTLRRLAAHFAFAAAILALAPGCSRKFFRQRADKEVEGVLTQKNVFPDWQIRNWNVYPDSRARFADNSKPDRPPYPPDDYAARKLSPNPQWPGHHSGTGRTDGDGYMNLLTRWDAENRAGDPPPPAPKPKDGDEPEKKEPEKEKLPPPKSLMLAPAPSQFGKGVGSLSISPAVWVAAKEQPGPRITEIREPATVIAAGGVAQMAEPAKAEPPRAAAAPEKLPAPTPLTADPDPAATPDPAADFLTALNTSEYGYKITMQQAIELGLLNSREFQDRREDLYLAALPVTLERFSFAAQAFFTEQVVRESTGRLRPEGQGDRWRLNTTTGFSKLFPTGAQLLVQLANQFVIDLTGDRPRTSVSNATLSLAQPFLRGGGFAVTLEPLTQAERSMVYAVRSYARFRKLYYVSVTAGGGITNNPYGLQGLSVNLGRGIGGNLTAPSVGFLPLLLRKALIANQQQNIKALETLQQRYADYSSKGGSTSPLQVDQVRQTLLSSRTQLLGGSSASGGNVQGVRGLIDAADNFKLQLGLPLTVGLDVQDAPLRPIKEQLKLYDQVYEQLRAVRDDVEEGRKKLPTAAVPPLKDAFPAFRAAWEARVTDSDLAKGTKAFKDTIKARLEDWKSLDAKQREGLLAFAEDQRKKPAAGPEFEKLLRDRATQLSVPAEQVARLLKPNEIDLGKFVQAVWVYRDGPGAGLGDAEKARKEAEAPGNLSNAANLVLIEAKADRLSKIIRPKWPALPPLPIGGVDIRSSSLDEATTAGIQLALTQRLDLMNARGQVVDSWRQIKVQANSLQGVFTLGYALNAATPATGTDPLAFTGSANRHQVTANVQLPLIRRAERNNYRAALISYQRQRRTLQAFEDNIANDVRADVRELRALAELYNIQKQVVELGYSVFDNAQEQLNAPSVPGANNDAGSAAALAQQVLQAQSQLLTAQNDLYTIWVNYQIARMGFYLDLESLQIDERGVWCDEYSPGNDATPRPTPDSPPGDRGGTLGPRPGDKR